MTVDFLEEEEGNDTVERLDDDNDDDDDIEVDDRETRGVVIGLINYV